MISSEFPKDNFFSVKLMWKSRKQLWYLVKFIYSEKATKFRKIFTLLLTTVHRVKSKVKISHKILRPSQNIRTLQISVMTVRTVFFAWLLKIIQSEFFLPYFCIHDRKKNPIIRLSIFIFYETCMSINQTLNVIFQLLDLFTWHI